MWAGIMLDGCTHLYDFERGTVTAVRYKDEVLQPYLHLYWGSPDFILKDNNAMPFTARFVNEFLESEHIRWTD
ncbi:transposable element Tcb2 transposase [Trichonephila clavipes]|nr:transposable element Tcb2 transposase [Trichonephila clavipes]